METEKPYLIQYCNLIFELHSQKIDADNMSKEQTEILCKLRAKAIQQSGLTFNELTLICMCRKYRIFKKVNIYANRIKHL